MQPTDCRLAVSRVDVGSGFKIAIGSCGAAALTCLPIGWPVSWREVIPRISRETQTACCCDYWKDLQSVAVEGRSA